MSSIAISAANLGKLYHIGRGQGIAGYRTLRESMMDWAKAPLRWFNRDGREALKDVSFEVRRATHWGNWQMAIRKSSGSDG